MTCDLIFCMAGLYSRFRDAGYDTPKYLLPWRDKTILHHVLAAYLPDDAFDRVLLVANKRDHSYAQAISEAAEHFGIHADNLVFIDDTSGQTETALVGLSHLGITNKPVAFTNIDTVLCNRDWSSCSAALATADGYIDTFPSTDPAFSYVSLDDQQVVASIREKVVISDMATSGFYAFTSAIEFADRARENMQHRLKEHYISDVYTSMIQRGAKILIGRSNAESTLVLGTPAQYEGLS